jgi:hypothetical protein
MKDQSAGVMDGTSKKHYFNEGYLLQFKDPTVTLAPRSIELFERFIRLRDKAHEWIGGCRDDSTSISF